MQKSDSRVVALAEWARSSRAGLDLQVSADAPVRPVSDDASFRRYFRFSSGAEGIVFVDAPPEHEDNHSFVRIAGALLAAGINCPRLLAADLEQGFMAITDLGDQLYLQEIRSNPSIIDDIYDRAVATIVRMQAVDLDLPIYDCQRLMDEMSLFHDWFLDRQLGLRPAAQERKLLEPVYELLVESALEQPARFVHRDFHCRNLMLAGEETPAVLDFQDAVIGPVTYDLVSLYKDCYYRFDRDLVERAVADFHQRLQMAGTLDASAPLLRWFDLMGMQRHLKCAGIFCRLNLRDGKPRYLADIPLVLDYLIEASGYYPDPALADFHGWMKAEVEPRFRRSAQP
ncbi:MAG: phosphotransferase [Proteobacteria bacterium]|nr:phosphotransferase [Pseudomonadota bacterium]